MTVLVTGAAGFIGFHVSAALLRRGESVIGVDNLSDYYSVALKQARLKELAGEQRFRFHRLDLAGKGKLESLLKKSKGVDRVIHLAAQPGVRYSLENPRAYVASNLVAQLEVLEACRHLKGLKHLVFASSSSVYGGNVKLPFSEGDPVDHPQSLYAATKKADELMSYCYAHLYRLPMTGLRFFTVYGPWGRPDMAAWLFTEAIVKGKPIRLYNHGKMQPRLHLYRRRGGGRARLSRPPARFRGRGAALPHLQSRQQPQRGSPAFRRIAGARAWASKPGSKTCRCSRAMCRPPMPTSRRRGAISASSPPTSIEEGLPRFVAWYRRYHKL